MNGDAFGGGWSRARLATGLGGRGLAGKTASDVLGVDPVRVRAGECAVRTPARRDTY